MPTYNSANYLERTLKSLTQMIGADKAVVEVLFVDDGSTDQTLTLLEKQLPQILRPIVCLKPNMVA